MSEPVKPIQYWVDSGAPEDVKKALVEGASWWNQAFEAAGFRNAFKVDVLPEGADPMDIRYNMINWVHRSTRGWSSGGSVSDPRTGEIIKATVTLGSLRDRQDYMIFEGLLSPYANGDEQPAMLYETALARIRQLSAHEVGHTLGLGHNYYDSKKGWISVMDYPHPLEELKADGTIDLSKAYTARIGEWDKVAINYGYREFPKGTSEAPALRKILDDAWAEDLRYYTNQDTDIHPRVEQWSNGVNQADELTRLMKVRRAALNRIGQNTIRSGDADGDDRRAAGADLHVSPLRGGSRGVDDRRPGLHLRDARRRHGTPMKWVDGEAQRKAIDVAGGDAQAVGAGPAEEHPRADSAASAGLRHAPRAVPAHDRRRLRPDQPGDDRRRRHDRLRAAARSRRAHGGAERGRPVAARAGRSHRSADSRDVRSADDQHLRSGDSPRGRARARRSRHVAGRASPEQPGARDRVAQAAAAGGAAARTAPAARPERTWRSTRCSPPTSSASSSGRPRPGA